MTVELQAPERPAALHAGRGPAVRTLLVFTWFWRYSAAQAVALRRAGVDLALLHPRHLYEFKGRAVELDAIDEAIARAGIRRFSLPERVSSLGSLPSALSLARRLRRWAPELVHVHDNHDPRMLAIARAPACVLTIHDPRPHVGASALSGARRRIRDAWIRRADRIVVHGSRLRDELSELVPGKRIVVIPHGTAVSHDPLEPPERPSVLLFGRIERYKGVDVLVAAMERVWRQRPEVRLVVAGAGPATALVPATDPRIELLADYVPEAKVDELLGRSSIVVLPYLSGSQSGVGLRALGRGVPLVVSDVGALPELAEVGGAVAPPADPDALAAAVLGLLDHDLGLRRTVLEHARRRFSWEVVAGQTAELYRELVAA
jgi:glycosyltransferase involved in cell wall biosynthesis